MPGEFTAVAVAEHALFLMLVLAKRLREAEQSLRAGIMHRPLSDELEGSTLGLIGLGASGKGLARRAAAIGMRVIAVEAASVSPEELIGLSVERCESPDRLDQLLGESDYVSIHIPLMPGTRNLISAEKLALMKPTAVLINVARGGIVDEEALATSLRERRLRGAGIDVFSHEPPDVSSALLQLPNVVATPHVAGSTSGVSKRRAEACVQNLIRIADGLPPLYEVTAPTA